MQLDSEVLGTLTAESKQWLGKEWTARDSAAFEARHQIYRRVETTAVDCAIKVSWLDAVTGLLNQLSDAAVVKFLEHRRREEKRDDTPVIDPDLLYFRILFYGVKNI